MTASAVQSPRPPCFGAGYGNFECAGCADTAKCGAAYCARIWRTRHPFHEAFQQESDFTVVLQTNHDKVYD